MQMLKQTRKRIKRTMSNDVFEQVCDEILKKEREQNGIGTLGEKTVHAVLKKFYEPQIENQEIRIGGYVADIFHDGEITEIQTRNFNALRKKLDVFLEEYHVTIVHPIPHNKWLVWIDEETGEMTKRRRSPRTGSIYQVFPEMYKLKMYLKDPKLHFCFPLIDMEEQRLLNGWSADRKKGSTRHDRIPIDLVDEVYIGGTEEFYKFLPEGLSEKFTVEDYRRVAKVSKKQAQTAITVLSYIGTIERVGTKNRFYLYKRK